MQVKKGLWGLLILTLGFLLFYGGQSASEATTQSHIQSPDIWDQAEHASSYKFVSSVNQVTSPHLKLVNAGAGPTTEMLYVEGTADQASESLQLKIWSGNGSVTDNNSHIELRIDETQTIGRIGSNDWQTL
ncbi:MAG: hypothetical protein AAF902_11925, partial [Chloroflexota bacterium]